MTPGKLTLAGLFVDLRTHLGHRLLDFDAGLRDVADQCAGERRVLPVGAVECGLARAGRERDQRAFAGLHLGKAGADRDTARRRGFDPGGERIVAAGIEEHQLHLGIAHGLVEREVDIDGGAELDVHLRLDVGVDRQEIVGAADGDAVTGIEEHGDVGALSALAKVEQLLGHLVAGQVGAFDDVEADIAEHGGHRLGVDRRVRQLRDVLVGAVADHEGHAFIGHRRLRGEHHHDQGKED